MAELTTFLNQQVLQVCPTPGDLGVYLLKTVGYLFVSAAPAKDWQNVEIYCQNELVGRIGYTPLPNGLIKVYVIDFPNSEDSELLTKLVRSFLSPRSTSKTGDLTPA